MKVNERFNWAVDILDIHVGDNILEIGCGPGVAVELIAQQLTTGIITAIDRSKTMIERAVKRNKNYIDEKKAVLKTSALAQVTFNDSFNKVFAFNVNLFWTGRAVKELEIIKQYLEENGAFFLFYMAPAVNVNQRITEVVRQNLEREGFIVTSILTGDLKPVPPICIISKLNDNEVKAKD
jgi:trans-aconitate methyltransferase